MLFNSFVFFVFFFFLHLVYWNIDSKKKKYLLIFSSIFFYGFWSISFLFHFLFIVCVNYFFYRFTYLKLTKTKLFFGILINLFNLVIFKYWNFLHSVLFDILGLLNFIGIVGLENKPTTEIILPLAISFYTFQIIGFHIDNYRKEISDKISLLEFSTFILFFPQLVAGPIMRFQEFISRFRKKKYISEKSNYVALFFILSGLVKKVIIADSIASAIDPIFANPADYNWKSLVLGVYGFSIQIYCDFAGYSDIARGLSLSLGIKIPANFKSPYFSFSFSEFWTRWHITLSRWLKDYLYIPLGGNKISKYRTLWNLFFTMVIGGVWHGANYTFLIWGFLHSLYLIFERIFFRKRNFYPLWEKIIRGVVVFHLVALAWIFFRSDSVSKAFTITKGILSKSHGLNSNMPNAPLLILLFFLLHYFEYSPKSFGFVRRNFRVSLPVFGFLVAVVIVTITSNSMSFIYFQF
ncbi:MAG: MBOAT family protein [Leptospiraceae bacterium]|nr:MBOAT family protein [Leptospiraceae bacterium]MCK6380175.1 MBOAT family protein [Leptospiraceae bacterium]NUM41205.1 MBOAT family protein [Leptospiraceae bacterium]